MNQNKLITLLLIFGGLLMTLSETTKAEFRKGDNRIRLGVGPAWPTGDLQTTSGSGNMWNVNYRHQTWSKFSLGGDFSFIQYGDKFFEGTTFDADLFNFGLMLRFDFTPQRKGHPYVSAGPTYNIYEAKVSGTSPNQITTDHNWGGFAAVGYEHQFLGWYNLGGEVKYDRMESNDGSLALMLTLSFKAF